MRILLADDHRLLRDGLRPLLGKVHSNTTVIEASDLPEAIRAVEGCGGVDLALLDLRMPGMDGLEGLARFQARFPGTRVALLSAFGDSETVLDSIRAGAAGFIPKTIGGPGFVNAVRLILSGEVYVPGNTLLEFGALWSPCAPAPAPPIPDDRRHAVGAPHCPAERFTGREQTVMRMLVDGLQNKMIARELGLQEPTVKACLRTLYRKINATNRTHAVKIILDLEGRLR